MRGDTLHFRVMHVRRHLSLIRLSLVLGFLFFTLYTLFDFYIFPESFGTLAILRFGSLPVAVLVIFPLTCHRRFPRWAPLLLSVGVVVGSVGLTLLQLFAASPYNSIYFAGMLVLLFFCYGVLMIPFAYAIAGGISATILHCGIMAMYGTEPVMVQLAEAFILVSVNLAGAVVVRFRDTIEQRAFAAKHRVALQNGELTRSKDYLEERVMNRTRELQQTNHQLHRALEERTQLIQEVYHRVGNNLQMMASLFQLEISNEDSDPELKLLRMQSRVRSMASVHSLLYGSTDYSVVSFRDVVSDFAHAGQYSLAIELKSEEINLGLEQALTAALLINELLAVSQGGDHAGPIVVSLEQLNGSIVVSIGGVQWDNEGHRVHTADSLSEHLLSSLAGQLAADVGFSDECGAVTVTFPVRDVERARSVESAVNDEAFPRDSSDSLTQTAWGRSC